MRFIPGALSLVSAAAIACAAGREPSGDSRRIASAPGDVVAPPVPSPPAAGSSGFGNAAPNFDGGPAPIDAAPATTTPAETTTRREDCGAITAIVRDFSSAHPDFEMAVPLDWMNLLSGTSGLPGIVRPALENGFPAYAHAGSTTHTTGPLEFYQWYVDTSGVNVAVSVAIPLTETTPGKFVYDNAAFFPIDGQGFGDEGNLHNYHFTTEVRTEFTYRGGEVFTFRGDDDLWMFVNGQLVIDLGGLHGPLEATVVMDQVAPQIGLVPEQTYAMDIFHAERHTFDSNFRIETNIDCFVTVEPPPPPPPPRVD